MLPAASRVEGPVTASTWNQSPWVCYTGTIGCFCMFEASIAQLVNKPFRLRHPCVDWFS